jgi:hypothetical protein
MEKHFSASTISSELKRLVSAGIDAMPIRRRYLGDPWEIQYIAQTRSMGI